jgi:hypothetical protein
MSSTTTKPSVHTDFSPLHLQTECPAPAWVKTRRDERHRQPREENFDVADCSHRTCWQTSPAQDAPKRGTKRLWKDDIFGVLIGVVVFLH